MVRMKKLENAIEILMEKIYLVEEIIKRKDFITAKNN